MENDCGISAAEVGRKEGPSDMLEDYGHGGGGIVHDGDLADIVRVDQGFDQGTGLENGGLEGVEAEIIWLL